MTSKLYDEDEKFSDELDILRHQLNVHGVLKKNITDDYTMAILNDKDREAVIEMTSNSHMIRHMTEKLANNSWESEPTEAYKENGHTIYHITKRPLTKEERQDIINIGHQTFHIIQKRVDMCCIMNRNRPDNHLIKYVAGQLQDIKDQNEEEETNETSIIKRIFQKGVDRNTKREGRLLD